MRLSDYVMKYLEEINIKHIFMLSGGGIMYLVDSLGRSKIEYVCCHHEQAAGIAAQAYAMQKNDLGVCMVTTGPGGTNALTAAGAAYVDSTPVLFITGQVKTTDFATIRNVRQFGAQENDIVSMVKPITKYAVTILEANKIRYYLEKAVYLALHGRKGPVWIDIPLDIQNEDVDEDTLESYKESEQQYSDITAELYPNEQGIGDAITKTIMLLKEAKRPLFLVGHGVVAAKAQELFCKIVDKVKVPVVATWRALDVMDFEDLYFFGSPGLQANRYSNIITQGADLLIVLGSRLDNMITAFNEEHFAFRAKKIVVDIDSNEINKLAMSEIFPVVCDVGIYLRSLAKALEKELIPDYAAWFSFCTKIKKRFPLLNENQEIKTALVDLYQVSMKISEFCSKDDVLVASSTSRCNTAGHMAFKHKKGQKTISSMGFGSMGFALPSVIGAWFANEKNNNIVMLEGDGSFQLNIQELQTIVHNHINAKLFVFHNAGYAAIATMQNRNFQGYHVGCDAESGVTLPDLEKISYAYGIPYECIRSNNEIEPKVSAVMKQRGPVLCEFVGSILFDEIPKCISRVDENGKRISAYLENPFPFLSDEEMREIYMELTY